jgi:peptidoglycan/xylan/chitin deacetylase (PgdA/CDA1 family)
MNKPGRLLRRVIQRMKRVLSGRGGPSILMYHRISNAKVDPWGLNVTPERFAAQVDWLTTKRTVLPICEFVDRLTARKLPRKSVAITFDDGYLDNLVHAKPVLDAAGASATVFLTTGLIGSAREFWWDELARRILEQEQAVEATVPLGDESSTIQLPSGKKDRVASNWRAWEPTTSVRGQTYRQLWEAMRRLDCEQRRRTLTALAEQLPTAAPAADSLPMQPEDIPLLLQGRNITVGAHTVSHPPLTTISMEARRREILESKIMTEQLAGSSVAGFAYPHGDCDPETISLVREVGFNWACSTRSATVNRQRYDLFALPRLQVMNWTPHELAMALMTLE